VRKSILCSALAAALLISCGKKEDPVVTEAAKPAAESRPGEVVLPPDSPKLKQIKVEPVIEAQVPTDEVDAPGKIEVNPNRVSRVGIPVAGRLTTVSVKVGDAVHQGQPLVTIESPDADAAMSTYIQAEAGISQAKANLLKSQSDYDRVKDLFEHNAVAKKEVLNAENAQAVSRAALEQAVANQRQSLRKLEILGLKPGVFGQNVVVAAPISGKILELTAVQGEYRNDTTSPIMTIADLSSVWVASDVPETDIRLIQVGERLEIQLTAFPDETFTGRVTRIADVVDPQTRTIKVRAEMDNSRGRFRPEMFGRIRHVEALETRAVIPASALIQGDGQNVVFREVSPGRFVQTPVTLGNRYKDRLPVIKGLSAGDRIVTDGAMLLRTN
jgi:cobalt-zinc-cadmium efflux system membrane fusion protein